MLIEKYDGVVFHFLGNLKHFPRKEDVSEHTYDAVATLEKARDTERKAFTFMRDSSMAAGTE